jgi:hypothetical protein
VLPRLRISAKNLITRTTPSETAAKARQRAVSVAAIQPEIAARAVPQPSPGQALGRWCRAVPLLPRHLARPIDGGATRYSRSVSTPIVRMVY